MNIKNNQVRLKKNQEEENEEKGCTISKKAMNKTEKNEGREGGR